MKKLLLATTLLLLSSQSLAAESIQFNFTPMEEALPLLTESAQPTSQLRTTATQHPLEEAFKVVSRHYSPQTDETITNYRQTYQGIEVLGGNLTVQTPGKTADIQTRAITQQPKNSKINGTVINQLFFDERELNDLNSQQKLDQSLESVIARYKEILNQQNIRIKPSKNKLVIGLVEGEAKLLYQLSFYLTLNNKKRLMTMLVDANNPDEVIKTWDNLRRATPYAEVGPGGTTKTGKYKFGQDGVPKLVMEREGDICIMRNQYLKVVNALDQPENDNYKVAYRNICGKYPKDKKCYCTNSPWWMPMFDNLNSVKQELTNEEEVNNWVSNNYADSSQYLKRLVRGWLNDPRSISEYRNQENCFCAFSPANDAFYFGQVVIDLFNNWYQTAILNGRLVLRTHIVDTALYLQTGEQSYANAYFDPETNTMGFGDGERDEYYPFVSLDITGHVRKCFI